MADINLSTAVGGGSNIRLSGGGGGSVAALSTTTITPPTRSRVVLTSLTHGITGGTNQWELRSGAETVFANGDIILDDINPTLTIGGRVAVVSNGVNTSGSFVFGFGEEVDIQNLHATQPISFIFRTEKQL
jgi:hypothetical protein